MTELTITIPECDDLDEWIEIITESDGPSEKITVTLTDKFLDEYRALHAEYWRNAYDALNEKTSYSSEANEFVKRITTDRGDLAWEEDKSEIIYDAGSKTVIVDGWFTSDQLLAIAMHMRSQK